MPIFEYRCGECSKRFSALVGMVAEAKPPTCPACGSVTLKKLISKFVSPRSEEDMFDDLGDKLERLDDNQNPRQLREMTRELGKAMDEDMSDDLEEMFEEDINIDNGEELD